MKAEGGKKKRTWIKRLMAAIVMMSVAAMSVGAEENRSDRHLLAKSGSRKPNESKDKSTRDKGGKKEDKGTKGGRKDYAKESRELRKKAEKAKNAAKEAERKERAAEQAVKDARGRETECRRQVDDARAAVDKGKQELEAAKKQLDKAGGSESAKQKARAEIAKAEKSLQDTEARLNSLTITAQTSTEERERAEKDHSDAAGKSNAASKASTQADITVLDSDQQHQADLNNTVTEQTTTINEQQQNQSNSLQAGDPVRITSGTYVMEEEELGIIKRSYTSGKKGSGRIGKWWVSNLDQRLIRSVDRYAPEFYKAADTNRAKADQLYDEAEIVERDYAARWAVAADETYLAEIKGKRDGIRLIAEQAAHSYKRYQVLTALNKYTVNSETPDYYWGCGNEKLVWVDDEGFPSIYEMSGKGVWVPLDKGKKQYSRIESRDGGGAESEAGFILYEKGGVKKYFNKWGLLEKIEYSPYEAITYIRNDEQQAVRIEMPHHQVYQLRYNAGGNLSRVTDPVGQTVRYSYESGKLTSVMDEAGDEVRYEYNYDGLLEKIIKPDDSRITIIYGETDAEKNAYVTATEDEEGNREHFTYYRSEKYTVHTNHRGVVEKIWYDGKHRTVKEEKADGSVIVYEYDEKGNKTRAIENGLATNYTYDGRGRGCPKSMQVW